MMEVFMLRKMVQTRAFPHEEPVCQPTTAWSLEKESSEKRREYPTALNATGSPNESKRENHLPFVKLSTRRSLVIQQEQFHWGGGRGNLTWREERVRGEDIKTLCRDLSSNTFCCEREE